MYCWGSTENGELGLGASETEQVLVPTFNDFGFTWKIKQIGSGVTHTLFLTEGGQVYSSGNNDAGQLGHNKPNRRPELISALVDYNIKQVAAGDQHSMALTSWGTIYAWGENGFGQLGTNSSESHSDVPKLIKTLATKQIVQVACGSNHSLALTLDNEVYSWGQNSNGQLGLCNRDSPIRDPRCIKVLTPVPIVLIAGGGQHSVALTKGGFLCTWGSNKYGQLGRTTENVNYCSTPKVVPNLATYSDQLRYVALGGNHTAVLDSLGKLWTFGHGRYGQLGHGSCDDTSVPRPVLDLIGSQVSQVACGRLHTLVYVPSQGQLYSFGQGMSGQLGVKSAQNRNVPHVVIGPWRAPSGRSICSLNDNENVEELSIFYVKNVFAGGDSSFVSLSSEKNQAPNMCVTCPFDQPAAVKEEHIDSMLSLGQDGVIDDDLFTYCETVLGSLGCWNRSFIKEGTSKVDHCLDFRLAEQCMNKLGRISRETLLMIAETGIEKATRELPDLPLTREALRSFIILPLWKGFLELNKSLRFQRPFANALLNLDITSAVIFKRWLHSLPIDYLRLLVNQYKKVVSYIIKSQKNISEYKPLTQTIEEEKNFLQSSLKILDLLYKENKSVPGRKFRIPYEEFYIPEITENVDIRKDYFNWLFPSAKGVWEKNQICFCEYSFLFDSQAKSLLLRADATRQMQGAINEAVQQSNPLLWLINPQEIQFLTLYVHRDKLVADTLSQLERFASNEINFKKPLKVQFIGEEAEDAGGVRKEFFLLVLKELLNPDYGMFVYFPDTCTIWFREGTLETDMYTLIGFVCGLAIYNFTIINLPFPIALYKKLLGESVDLDDLAEMDPVLVKNLRNLLEYEGGDIEDIFCLNFTVTQDYFGETVVVPLKPNGENVLVNSDNKQEYVDLLVDHRLNRGIEQQYRSFHRGFHRVCGEGVLKLFQPLELMALVTGNENYDWEEFKKNTSYKGDFSPDHQTIRHFWEVFEELSLDQKKKFLMFLTGCDRVPILGMKVLKMVIEPTSDTNFLPVAHTCVSQLDLPRYSTKEKLKYKLLQAIQQNEGFGLV